MFQSKQAEMDEKGECDITKAKAKETGGRWRRDDNIIIYTSNDLRSSPFKYGNVALDSVRKTR